MAFTCPIEGCDSTHATEGGVVSHMTNTAPGDDSDPHPDERKEAYYALFRAQEGETSPEPTSTEPEPSPEPSPEPAADGGGGGGGGVEPSPSFPDGPGADSGGGDGDDGVSCPGCGSDNVISSDEYQRNPPKGASAAALKAVRQGDYVCGSCGGVFDAA